MTSIISFKTVSKLDFMIALGVFTWAVAMKRWYQTAVVDQLHWMLGPTAKIVGWMCDDQFRFIWEMGYLSEDRTILINKDCSGVNFLIIITTFSFAIRSLQPDSFLGRKTGWLWIPILSYLLAIAANTTRIRISMLLIPAKNMIAPWISPEAVHRAEGICIYLFFIVAFYFFCCLPIGSSGKSANTV